MNITNIRIIYKILTHSRLLLDRLDQAIKPNLNNEDKPAIEDILNPENKIYNNKK